MITMLRIVSTAMMPTMAVNVSHREDGDACINSSCDVHNIWAIKTTAAERQTTPALMTVTIRTYALDISSGKYPSSIRSCILRRFFCNKRYILSTKMKNDNKVMTTPIATTTDVVRRRKNVNSPDVTTSPPCQ